MEKLISIGKIVNFHGIKGEVKLGYTKGQEKQILSLSLVYLKENDNLITLNIQNIKFHKNFAIVKFKELNSIDDVMKVKGQNVFVEKNIIANNLAKDEYLASDLIGLEVFDTNNKHLGFVAAVSSNCASDLLSVKIKDNSCHLIPFVEELVPIVDIKNRKIIINNIEGLLPKL